MQVDKLILKLRWEGGGAGIGKAIPEVCPRCRPHGPTMPTGLHLLKGRDTLLGEAAGGTHTTHLQGDCPLVFIQASSLLKLGHKSLQAMSLGKPDVRGLEKQSLVSFTTETQKSLLTSALGMKLWNTSKIPEKDCRTLDMAISV